MVLAAFSLVRSDAFLPLPAGFMASPLYLLFGFPVFVFPQCFVEEFRGPKVKLSRY
jgi:hypothetical protein